MNEERVFRIGRSCMNAIKRYGKCHITARKIEWQDGRGITRYTVYHAMGDGYVYDIKGNRVGRWVYDETKETREERLKRIFGIHKPPRRPAKPRNFEKSLDEIKKPIPRETKQKIEKELKEANTIEDLIEFILRWFNNLLRG